MTVHRSKVLIEGGVRWVPEADLLRIMGTFAGWKLVPIEASQEMLIAPSSIVTAYAAGLIYKRMVLAAPPPPAPPNCAPEYVLVPIEPTGEMLEAWADEGLTVDDLAAMSKRYAAMLGAAP